MSTTTVAPQPTRALPARAMLVELGAADAIRERLMTATRALRNPADLRRRLASARAQVAEGVRRLERRGERISNEVRRHRPKAPPMINPAPFPL